MTTASRVARLLAGLPERDRALALLYFVAAIGGLVVVTWLALASLADRYAAYSESADLLAKLEGRRTPPAQGEGADGGNLAMTGSPFLEATTLTIAGAELQKHITALVQASGGNVLSSQVDLQQAEGSSEHVGLTITVEVDQSAVQKLLYDIEAGMPLLFIDRLQIQPVQAQGGDSSGARLRAQLTISGQWQQVTP
jgi:general secretion pathway protein M